MNSRSHSDGGYDNEYVNDLLYLAGVRKPHYPLPVTLDTADIAIGWIRLSVCPFEHPCNVCLDNYMDDLTYHFPEAFD